MPEEGTRRMRLHIVTAFFMVAVALLFDASQFFATFLNIVPGLGVIVTEFISIFSIITFGFWFTLCGVSYLDRNGATKMMIMITSVVTELGLFLNALPAITFGVISLILITRMEDQPGSSLLGSIMSVEKKRLGSMTDVQQVAARQQADRRMRRDTEQRLDAGRESRVVDRIRSYDRSAESRRVEEVRGRDGMQGYSSPAISSYLQERGARSDAETRAEAKRARQIEEERQGWTRGKDGSRTYTASERGSEDDRPTDRAREAEDA